MVLEYHWYTCTYTCTYQWYQWYSSTMVHVYVPWYSCIVYHGTRLPGTRVRTTYCSPMVHVYSIHSYLVR